MEKICMGCGKSFKTYYRTQKCCCRPCTWKNKETKQKRINGIIKALTGVKRKPIIERVCLNCGKSFVVTHKTHEFCRKECATSYSWKNANIRKNRIKNIKTKFFPGMIPWNKGLTKETSIKVLETSKKVRDTCMKKGLLWGYGKIPPINLPCRNSKMEKRFCNQLRNIVIQNFKMSKYILGCYPDILFEEEKLAVFCDGNYWHNYPYGTEKDKRQNKILKKNGWKVLRFWEHEINKDANTCIEKIINNLEEV